jgi:hypothetical protein
MDANECKLKTVALEIFLTQPVVVLGRAPPSAWNRLSGWRRLLRPRMNTNEHELKTVALEIFLTQPVVVLGRAPPSAWNRLSGWRKLLQPRMNTNDSACRGPGTCTTSAWNRLSGWRKLRPRMNTNEHELKTVALEILLTQPVVVLGRAPPSAWNRPSGWRKLLRPRMKHE